MLRILIKWASDGMLCGAAIRVLSSAMRTMQCVIGMSDMDPAWTMYKSVTGTVVRQLLLMSPEQCSVGIEILSSKQHVQRLWWL